MNEQETPRNKSTANAEKMVKKKWCGVKGFLKRLSLYFLFVFVLLSLQLQLRTPWISPLPNISLEPSYPVITEADLGPDSAYRLLLKASAPPVTPETVKKPTTKNSDPVFPEIEEKKRPNVWETDCEAMEKIEYYGWPKTPPTTTTISAAPPPKNTKEKSEEKIGVDLDASMEMNVWSTAPSPWTLAQYRDIERQAKLYETKLNLLDRALAAPNPQMPRGALFKDYPPYLKDVRKLSHWLVISAYYRAANQDYNGSCRDLERMLEMGNLISRGGSQPNINVGISCQANAAESAWLIATREDLPLPILKQLAQAFLHCKDEIEPFAESLREDFLILKKELPQMYSKGNPPVGKMNQQLKVLFFALMGATRKNTSKNLSAYYQHLISLAQKPYTPKHRNDFKAFPKKHPFVPNMKKMLVIFLCKEDPFGYFVTSSTASTSVSTHERFVQRNAILAGTSLFLALKAYEKQHGNVPETLAALVPDFLPKLPKDPFGDQPFHYRHGNLPNLPASAWAVYSVGKNFTDDQGEASCIGTDPGKAYYLNKLDLVWPSQPYPKE